MHRDVHQSIEIIGIMEEQNWLVDKRYALHKDQHVHQRVCWYFA